MRPGQGHCGGSPVRAILDGSSPGAAGGPDYRPELGPAWFERLFPRAYPSSPAQAAFPGRTGGGFMKRMSVARFSPAVAAVALAVALPSCSGIERIPAPARPERSGTAPAEAPQIMRGTVAAETLLDGYRPVLVYGHGLVVGLNGTGASDVPPAVRAHMIETASRHGIGSAGAGWAELSPEDLLNSPDTAVVVVEAVIPPGSPKGTRFDVRVSAYPTSSTSSLEGGRLYTSELIPRQRPDRTMQVLPPTGNRQPASLAIASGPVLINPFAEPGSTERDTIDRRSGHILDGGVVSRDMPLKLRLATPSHARAMLLRDAINTRFPQEPGQRDPTARGESDESIALVVPPTYHDRTEEFLELLRHTTIRQGDAERVAMTIRRHLLENPNVAVAEHAAWRWRALGPRALPALRDLYDHPEEVPRRAALRAGAKLDDPLAVPELIDVARAGSPPARLEAIDLLAARGVDPQIDEALRGILEDSDVEIRLAAFEALVSRGDWAVQRFVVDDKFVVEVVESERPMIYISLMGLPRLAVFGRELAVERPLTMTAWSQRFMIKGDADGSTVEVYYRAEDAESGAIHRVSPQIPRFVQFLGHAPAIDRPEPGLGLSYGQVVGLLHQIWRQGYLDADFKAQQDPIVAAMMRGEPRVAPPERPEFGPEEAVEPRPEADMQEENADRPPPPDAGPG